MIVPKRQHSRSVDRNRIKRVIREWFRSNQKRLAGRDWIVRLSIGGNPAPALQHGWLHTELERLASESAA
jgi:ribonuclease P protein component